MPFGYRGELESVLLKTNQLLFSDGAAQVDVSVFVWVTVWYVIRFNKIYLGLLGGWLVD